ncbi:serine hydrolase [Patescibacteria group bacterium]|nr:serine hydrolase [Patescibacteria group bacterium]
MKWQLIIVLLLVLAAVAVWQVGLLLASPGATVTGRVPGGATSTGVYGGTASRGTGSNAALPVRDWSVLDPQVSSTAVLVQSLDTNFPYFRYNTDEKWPMASLTKLLTAVVVVENVGLDAKIPVSTSTATDEGPSGNLRGGEIYNSGDLLKIMLLASSNGAAQAFEHYVGDQKFLGLMMAKAGSIGMANTVVYDASGWDDNNETTASDMLKLLEYILAKHPEIFGWTRLTSFLAQPLNSSRTNIVSNIDQLSGRADFLGGKTGTSPKAGENLAGILSFRNEHLAFVILGSDARYNELDNILNWIDEAYTFPAQ